MDYRKHINEIEHLSKFYYFLEEYSFNNIIFRNKLNEFIFKFFDEYGDVTKVSNPYTNLKLKRDVYRLFNNKISLEDFLNLDYTSSKDHRCIDFYSFMYIIENSNLLIKGIETDNIKLVEKILNNSKFLNKLDYNDLLLVCNDFEVSKDCLKIILNHITSNSNISDMDKNFFLFSGNDEYKLFEFLTDLRKSSIESGDKYEINKINNTILNVYDIYKNDKMFNKFRKELLKIFKESCFINTVEEIGLNSNLFFLKNINNKNETYTIKSILNKENDVDKLINVAFDMYINDSVNFKSELKLFRNLELIFSKFNKEKINIKDKNHLNILYDIYNKDKNFIYYNIELYLLLSEDIKKNNNDIFKNYNQNVRNYNKHIKSFNKLEEFNFKNNLVEILYNILRENKSNLNRSNSLILFF